VDDGEEELEKVVPYPYESAISAALVVIIGVIKGRKSNLKNI
jgi:hypothetical protein